MRLYRNNGYLWLPVTNIMKKDLKEKTLFDNEKQGHKDRIIAAAAEYLAGRSGCKRRSGRAKHSRKKLSWF
jgi:hypothetical protein